MTTKYLIQSIGLIAGSAALGLSPQAFAADNPFGLSQIDGAAIVVAGDAKKGISVLEGKCGGGKCGSQRVRAMMDKNDDGRISRDEYVSWSSRIANEEFDKFAGGAADAGVDDVFEHFESLDYHTQG